MRRLRPCASAPRSGAPTCCWARQGRRSATTLQAAHFPQRLQNTTGVCNAQCMRAVCCGPAVLIWDPPTVKSRPFPILRFGLRRFLTTCESALPRLGRSARRFRCRGPHDGHTAALGRRLCRWLRVGFRRGTPRVLWRFVHVVLLGEDHVAVCVVERAGPPRRWSRTRRRGRGIALVRPRFAAVRTGSNVPIFSTPLPFELSRFLLLDRACR